MTAKKHIYMWFDGDIKRYYFSSKKNLNLFIKEFAQETKAVKNDYQDNKIKNKSIKQLIEYFSGPLFVEKIELDEVIC